MTFTKAAFSRAGDARRVKSVGTIDLRMPSAVTGGAVAIWEAIVGPQEGPPLHIHAHEDEVFFVLAGTFQFWCGDEMFVGGPGTVAVLPRNIPHTFRNIGDSEGRFFATCTPGGFENFFIELEQSGDTSPANLVATGSRYGLTIVPPKVEAA